MRLSLTILISSTVCAVAGPMERRQTPQPPSPFSSLPASLTQAMNAMMPTVKKAHKVERLAPTLSRPGVERIRLTYGPYTLKAANETTRTGNGFSMDPAGTAWMYLADTDFPRDVTVLRANASIAFENGTHAEIIHGIYDHHQLFLDTSKTTPQLSGCDGGWTMPPSPVSIFMGGAEEKGDIYFSTPDGKFNSGYYIGKDDKMIVSGDVVNYNTEQRTIYTIADFEYIKGRPDDFLDTSLQVLQVGMCNGLADMFSLLAPQKKKFSLQGKPMTIARDGYIVMFKGHVHDGGVNILIKLNGKEVCNSKAVYGTKGQGAWKTIDHMITCHNPIKVSKGDKVTLDAFYDMEENPPREQHGGGMAEVMALAAFMFASKL